MISGIMVVTACCALMLAVYSLRRRHISSIGVPLGLYMIAICEWAMTAALELLTADAAMKVMFVKLAYIGIASVPVLWLLVALEYNRSVKWIADRRMLLLWVVPVASVSMAATNEWHWLFWSVITPVMATAGIYSNGPLLIYGHGIAFWIFFAYSYAVLFAATFILIRSAFRSPELYRSQSVLMVIAMALLWIGNLFYVAEIVPIPGLDTTPIAFTLTGALLALGILRYRLLDIVPVACDVLIRNMGDGVIVLDGNNHIAEMNPASCGLFGVELRSVVGHDLQAVVSSRIEPGLLFPGGQMNGGQKEIHVTGDATAVYDVRSSPLCDERGRSIGRLVVFHDITELKRREDEIRGLNQSLEERVRMRTHLLEREMTEHKQAQEALRKSEEKYRLLLENISDVVFSTDTTGRFTYISPVIEQIAGYRPEEVVGKHFSFFVDQSDIHMMMTDVARIFSGESMAPREFRAVDKNGEVHYVRTSGRLAIEDGQIVGITGLMIDVTERHRIEEERRRLEAQLQHTQKLESLGVLAGGIAHDFNNILTGILGNADLAIMKIGEDSPVWDNLKEIQKGSFSAAELCRQMLAYSGKGRFELSSIDLREMVKEITQLLEVSISKKIAVRFEFPDMMPMINGDAAQVRQIIMNLVINASEAIGDETGAIMITIGSAHLNRVDLKETYLDDNLPEGEYAFIDVIDTGIGMDRGTIARIFEPFFTTKFTGRGLGLAAVLGIVRGHRGAVRITSEPGKGTSFRVFFPVSRDGDGHELMRRSTSGSWRGIGTILMVDDEESVLSVGKRMLELLGFSVLTAVNGIEAIAVFRENIESIVCVILDLTMPMMNGVETFKELNRIKPGVRVIISSGYSEYEISERFAGNNRVSGFVQKPYHFEDFAAKLRDVIG